MSLWFKGVNEPNGWMGNMAPYPILPMLEKFG